MTAKLRISDELATLSMGYCPIIHPAVLRTALSSHAFTFLATRYFDEYVLGWKQPVYPTKALWAALTYKKSCVWRRSSRPFARLIALKGRNL